MGLFHIAMLALLAGVLADPTTRVELSRTHARQGDEVTITCTVSDYEDDSLIVKMTKYVRVDEVDEETGERKIFEQDLSINNGLESPFNDITRYSISKVTTGSTGLEYVIRITDLRPEDTGTFVCQIGSTEAYDSQLFQVYTNPYNVHFMNFSNWDLNVDILELDEGQKENVGCMAMGGVPTPRFELVIGEANYTNWFKHHESEIVLPECYRPGSMENCPLHYTTESEVEAMEFRPYYTADGQDLECRAYIDGSDMEPVVAKLKIQMKYIPKFHCWRKHKVALHTKEYNLKCVVLTNPSLQDVKFEFQYNGETQMLQPGQATTDGEFQFENLKTLSATQTEVNLQISEVFERHYEMKFKLWAKSSLGQNSTMLELVDEDYDRGSGSNTVVYSAILALLAFILSVFML